MKNSTEKLRATSKEPEKLRAEGKNPYVEATKQRTIEDEKQEKKFMFQFVNHEDGTRSEPFVGNWDLVQEVLDARKEGERPNSEDYILLVAVLDGKDTQIPATPLITIKTFEEISKKEA